MATAVGYGVQQVVLRLAEEFELRQLGPGEQNRVSATLYWALEDIERRLDEGQEPRDDGFFVGAAKGRRPRADELLEATLTRAQREHEERKLRHLGWLYSAVVFDADTAAVHANFLLELAGKLTYQQLTLLSLFHQAPYRSLPAWTNAVHPGEVRAQAMAGELLDLVRHGLLYRTDSLAVRGYNDIDPACMQVGGLGCVLFHTMRLDEIESKTIHETGESLREVAELPDPWRLRELVDGTADAERLTQDDIETGRIRFTLDETARDLVPEPGGDAELVLRGVSLVATWDETAADAGCLRFHGDDRFHFDALVDEGAVLRLSRADDGTLFLG